MTREVPQPNELLKDRKAFVTGASRGIGKGIALALASAGADVAIGYVSKSALAQETAREIERFRRSTTTVELDVSKPEDVDKGFNTVISTLGHLDILVNNAGINIRGRSESLLEKDWRKVVDVNLTGVFLCSQCAAQHMIRRRRGCILNIASVSGFVLNRNIAQAAYYAAKAGVIQLTRALATEWARFGIRVNAISPGWVRTSLVEAEFVSDAKKYRDVVSDIPMGMFGEPNDIGPAAVFLCSEGAKYITGHNLVVDGGFSLL